MKCAVTFLLFYVLFTNSGVSSENKTLKELCKSRKCIQKCCPIGEYVLGKFVPLRTCEKTNSLKIPDFSEIPLYSKKLKPTGKNLTEVYTLVPGGMLTDPLYNNSFDFYSEEHIHYLTEDTILLEIVPNQPVYRYDLNYTDFCVDYLLWQNGTIRRSSFWTILPPTSNMFAETPRNVVFNTFGLFFSCIFFVLTMVIYTLLPDLRTLSGMILMAYVASMFCSFLLLAVIQLDQYTLEVCTGLTYVTYFFIIAGFAWMTIMSYSFWSMQCKHKLIRRRTHRNALSKFLIYSIFAWGLPLVLTIFLAVSNHADLRHIPTFIKPNIHLRGCFLGGFERLLYLYTPMSVLIIANWVFFLLSSCSLWREYQSTSMVDKQPKSGSTYMSHRGKVTRFFVYIKLSLLMGVNWVLEVLSSFYPDAPIWWVTDLYNMLIGFFIFVLFIGCRYRVIYSKLKHKYNRQDSINVTTTQDNFSY